MNTVETFLAHIEKQPNGCWKWLGSITVYGYGQYTFEGKNWRAHRLSYHLFVTPLTGDEEEYICHACNNKWCVAPEHLVSGNASVNYHHAASVGRIPDKDQRFGRKQTEGKDLPKGIYYDPDRDNYRVSIRVKEKRYQAN